MTEELRVETNGPDETEAFGARLARGLVAGDVLLLEGPFGAGKTTLVRGIAAGLGAPELVSSPSFVLANEYHGRLPLYHIDLYRLERLDAPTRDLLADYFGGDGVCAVEWPQALPPGLRQGAVTIIMRILGETRRSIVVRNAPERLRAAGRGGG